MKLEEVQSQIRADIEAREAEAACDRQREEQNIIRELAEIGILAVDGWDVRSNFPIDASVYVSHSQLPHTLLITYDWDTSPVPLRAHIKGEHPDISYSVNTITRVVQLMSKTPLTLQSDHGTDLLCPVMSPGEHDCQCQEKRCAWWNAHFHKCARAVLPSSGNP